LSKKTNKTCPNDQFVRFYNKYNMSNPLANIHPDAQIGPDVKIEAFTSIAKDVQIGKGTWIGPNVTIMDGARIGENCMIFPGAVIAAIPQDLKFAGEESLVIIGDNTTIREYVTVNRGTVDRKQTTIGQNCLLMAYTHVAHDCMIGNNCILANVVQLGGHVVVEDFAIIGGTSAVHQFVRIGAHAILSGGALVNKDVPPYTKSAKFPLTYHGINTVGLKRRGFTAEQIDELQEIYRTLYLSGKNTSDAVDVLQGPEWTHSAFAQEIVTFVKASKMGIMKGH